ncbi:MAG: diguanylate cyclase [Coriobacteriia bacterium]|nr:diguanylate cyclase [Coriobacteriia bacterium]
MAFALIPLLIVGSVAASVMYGIVYRSEYSKATSLVDATAFSVDTYFADVITNQKILARSPSVENAFAEGNDSAQGDVLKSFKESSDDFDCFMVIDEQNKVRASSLPQYVGCVFTQDSSSVQYNNEDQYVSSVVSSQVFSGLPWAHDEMFISTPCFKNGEYKGRIIAFLNLGYFERLMMTTQKSSMVAVAIFDSEGNGAVGNPRILSEEQRTSSQNEEFQGIVYGEAVRGTGEPKKFSTEIGKDRFLAAAQVATGSRWVVVGFVKASALYEPVVTPALIVGLVIFLILILANFVADMHARRLIDPFEKDFLPAIHAIAAGDRHTKIKYDKDDEIGMVSRAFNDLVEDIDERERELRVSEVRYRMMVEENRYIVFEWSAGTDTMEMAPLFNQRFGFNPSLENVSNTFSKLEIVFPDDVAEFKRFCDDIFIRHCNSRASVRLKSASGEYTWFEVRTVALYNLSQEYYGAFGTFSDIDAVKREEIRLREQNRTDDLSRVLNSRAFNDATDEMLEDSKGSDKTVTLFFIDIDDFKMFNTDHGHAFGDRVIRFFGVVLRTAADGYGVIGRVGGDEFAMCLELRDSDPSPEQISRQISSALARGLQVRDGGGPLPIRASIGIAQYPLDGQNYSELMHAADQKMYFIKQESKKDRQMATFRKLEDEGADLPT